jgi:membrane protein YdbS with pleckstrin-like domain
LRILPRKFTRALQSVMTGLNCKNNPATNTKYPVKPIVLVYFLVAIGHIFFYLMLPIPTCVVVALILIYIAVMYLKKQFSKLKYRIKSYRSSKNENLVKTYLMSDQSLVNAPSDD